MAHPDVALDVQGRRPGEPEGLHVSVDLCLEESALGPGSPEPTYEFVIYRASVLVDQLYALVAPVVCVAVVDYDVETVCWMDNSVIRQKIKQRWKVGKKKERFFQMIHTVLAAHVDYQGERIPDSNWSGDSGPGRSVTVPNLHVTFWRLEGEHYGITRRDSAGEKKEKI